MLIRRISLPPRNIGVFLSGGRTFLSACLSARPLSELLDFPGAPRAARGPSHRLAALHSSLAGRLVTCRCAPITSRRMAALRCLHARVRRSSTAARAARLQSCCRSSSQQWRTGRGGLSRTEAWHRETRAVRYTRAAGCRQSDNMLAAAGRASCHDGSAGWQLASSAAA